MASFPFSYQFARPGISRRSIDGVYNDSLSLGGGEPAAAFGALSKLMPRAVGRGLPFAPNDVAVYLFRIFLSAFCSVRPAGPKCEGHRVSARFQASQFD